MYSAYKLNKQGDSIQPHYILSATLTPDEKERIWQAAQTHANQLHNQDLGLIWWLRI